MEEKFQTHQSEVPKEVTLNKQSQSGSEDEVEQIQERPKENRLIKQHSFKDIIGEPKDGLKT